MRATADDIRGYAEQAQQHTGESVHVTQLPSQFLNALDSEGIVAESVLDDLRRKQMAVYNINSDMYKSIINLRKFYKIDKVGDYIIGELGGFRG
jgi:hypothetical protein